MNRVMEKGKKAEKPDRGIAAGFIGVVLVLSVIIGGCEQHNAPGESASGGGASETVAQIMQERGLSEADVRAAVKTYMPTGKHDDYLLFASGGQVGNVIVIGLPSMRILKYIGVFTPEPWQG